MLSVLTLILYSFAFIQNMKKMIRRYSVQMNFSLQCIFNSNAFKENAIFKKSVLTKEASERQIFL